MSSRRLLALAAATVLFVTGCSDLQSKVRVGKEFAKDMKPGHSYQNFFAPSDGMLPTIHAKTDALLVDTSAYASSEPQRGDIIVFFPPIRAENAFLKRVLAVPGDKLAVSHGRIAVNGKPLPPSYPPMHPHYDVAVSSYRITIDGEPLDNAFADVMPRARWTASDRLPRGCYFVIGDNVDNSEDSHLFGCAELRGTFTSGSRRGEPTQLVGKVVKIVPSLPPKS